MLGKLVRLIRSGEPKLVRHSSELTRIIDIIGAEIGTADGFIEQTSAAVDTALAYLDRQIASIPGPLPVSEALYGAGTGAMAFFPEVEDIQRAFGRSLAVKEKLPELVADYHEDVHALLGLRLKPRQNGADEIYADHVLHSLAPTREESAIALRTAAFERLLKNFAEHVEKLRRKERMNRLEWEWQAENATAAAAAGPAGEAAQEFVYADKELTPDNMLRGLISWLRSPEVFFQLRASPVALPGAGEIVLPRLHCSDRRQWLVCQISFSADEAWRALQRESHTHRYIFV